MIDLNDRYLYKAKRVDNGEWVEGFMVACDERIFIAQKPECNTNRHMLDGYWMGTYIEIDPSTICQCTGLKDKDGKLIWENDILRYSYDYPGSPWLAQKGLTDEDIIYRVGAVFWQDWRGTWAVCGRGKSKNTDQDIYKYSRNLNRVEVVGNVFNQGGDFIDKKAE